MLSKIILGVGIFATLLAVLFFSHPDLIPGRKGKTPAGEVILWGTLPETEMSAIVQQFNPQAKTYRVTYTEVPESQFGQRLIEALANGAGPDMIIAPYQEILKQSKRLYPVPVASLGEKSYKDTFVDGASLFYTGGGALALPVSIDPMVLFYNRTLLSKNGFVKPPTYWDEVVEMSSHITSQRGGKFLESAIALGADNTPYAKDILMSIVSELGQVPIAVQYDQLGTPFYDIPVDSPVTEGSEVYPLQTAARFFVQFADPTQPAYSWNRYAGNADEQFVSERLAMYIGYAGELSTLKARNPRAQFEMTYFPQTRGYNNFTMGMKMYGIATLKNTKNLNACFSVESQFSGSGVAPAIAAITGAVPALRAYAATPGLHEVTARSMLVAHGWLDIRPDESSAYVSTMISDILNYRQGVADAASTFVSRMRDLYTTQQ